jgi:hypothetical protein
MHPSQHRTERKAQRSTRHQLDGLVVNIELTLVSIIQGVALYFLTESSRPPLHDLRFDQWPYVANGLLVILLFWSRSTTHTLTLIRWPLEFVHNFLYIACTLIEAVTFTDLTDPIRWYAFSAAFAVAVWALFLTDLRLIRQRQVEAVGPAEEELYAIVLRDQNKNIYFLVPGMLLFNLLALFCIYFWPQSMIQGGLHVVFALIQTATLLGYLIYVVRFYGGIAPTILKANQEESE